MHKEIEDIWQIFTQEEEENMSLEEKQNFIISNQVVLITIDQNLKDGDEENVHIMFNT